jgi:hypothetical protein
MSNPQMTQVGADKGSSNKETIESGFHLRESASSADKPE